MSGLAVFWGTDEVWQGNARSATLRDSSYSDASSSDDDELASAFGHFAFPSATKKTRRGAQGKRVVARTAPGPSFDFAAFFAHHPTVLISHLRRELRREWRYAALRCERLEALLETHGIPLPKRLRGVRLRGLPLRRTAAGVQAALVDASNKYDDAAVDALRAAIEVAHAQHLPISAFLFGACSTLTKVFLLGAYPRALAAYFFVEFPVLCVVVVRTLWRQRMLVYLAEFCWVANVVGWCALALELFLLAKPSPLPIRLYRVSDAARINLARTFFAIANGPLSLSIITNKNVLVFHDVVRTSGLFVHLGPALASWGLRWYTHGAGRTQWVVEDAAAAGGSGDGESIAHLGSTVTVQVS